MKQKLHIVIGADIVPTKSNLKYFINAELDKLIDTDISACLAGADYIAMNLEVPLTDAVKAIAKCGPCLIAPTATVAGLKKINPFFYTLANNHILDQDVQGLKSTIRVLYEHGIAFAGVGNNLGEAWKPHIVKLNDVKIGFYCCAEHEFSIATETTPGANPFDPLESFDHVKELKKECDLVIVLYHGGKEHYRYPSPWLQKVFHKFADCGADYVIAQHTHCIGCEEKYKDSTLIYGQGNFLFDYSESDFWKTSLLIDIKVEKGKFSTDYIPLVKYGNMVCKAQGVVAEEILKNFYYRSQEIMKDTFIAENYYKFANQQRGIYFTGFSGLIGRLFMIRVINKLTRYKFMDFLYNKNILPEIDNMLECEAHRELAIAVMKSEKK